MWNDSIPFSNSSSNSSVMSEFGSCLYIPHESQKRKVIAIIYIVTSVLSILGAGSVLIYAVLKKTVRSPEVHPLFHLALADLILASLWLTGACTWFHNKYKNCFYLHVFGEMAHLTSFFLTVNYALTAFIRLQDKAQSISNLHFSSNQVHITDKFSVWISRICYAVCWLTPVVIMLPLLVHSAYHTIHVTQKSCTLCLLLFDRPKLKSGHKSDFWWSYGSIALTASLSISIVVLVLLYFLMLRVYRKAVLYSGVLTDLQRASIDAIRNKIFLYILVFLVCWSPALVVASCDIDPQIKPSSMPHWFTLFIFQGLTAPMQGFFNCIVYGWARKSFRDASEERSLLLESDEYSSSRPRRLFHGSSTLRDL